MRISLGNIFFIPVLFSRMGKNFVGRGRRIKIETTSEKRSNTTTQNDVYYGCAISARM